MTYGLIPFGIKEQRTCNVERARKKDIKIDQDYSIRKKLMILQYSNEKESVKPLRINPCET